MQFVALEPNIEIIGAAVRAAIGSFDGCRRLVERGFYGRSIDGARWYSQQDWLDGLRSIDAEHGGAHLFAIGEQMAANAIFPPTLESLSDAIAMLDIAYHLNHRKRGELMYEVKTGARRGGIGGYDYMFYGDRHLVCESDTPHPCELDFGVVKGLADRCLEGARVEHVEGACRRRGDRSCRYRVTWD